MFADPQNDVMPGPSGAASAPPPPRAQFSGELIPKASVSGELIPKASENNLFGVFLFCYTVTMYVYSCGKAIVWLQHTKVVHVY